MKTINIDLSLDKELEINESPIDRKFISRLGNSIYSQKEVKEVLLKISFKDGSVLVFNKDEEDDTDKERVKKHFGETEDENE